MPSSTRLVALLGHPVAHSRSPAMMSAAFRALGLDAVYLARDVPPGALGDAVRGLRALGFTGANVTIPHKVQVIPLLDHMDPVARAVGAVNTLVFRSGTLVGHNTDAVAVTATLRDAGCDPRGALAVVLGTGGAARAAAVGIAGAGARAVTVLGRRGDVALGVAAAAREAAPGCSAWGLTMPSPEADEALARATVVVQATPCGMDGGPPAEGLLAVADLARVPVGAVALDLVYAPPDTPWLRAAGERGLRTVAGAGVLVHQGAAALRLWFGVDPPYGVMRDALGLSPRG